MIAVAAGAAVAPRTRLRAFLIIGAVCAVTPDIDAIGRMLPADDGALEFLGGHRGFTHSLACAGLAGVVVASATPVSRAWDGYRVRLALFVTFATAAHGALDALTSIGATTSPVQFFSPFSAHGYISPWHPIHGPFGELFLCLLPLSCITRYVWYARGLPRPARSIHRPLTIGTREIAHSSDAANTATIRRRIYVGLLVLLAFWGWRSEARLADAHQTLNPSPREALNTARSLTTTEIATVLDASRQALTAKTFRVSFPPRGQGPEVLMGPAGRPKVIRTTYGIEGGVVSRTPGGATSSTESLWHEDFISIVDSTDRPARRCDGLTEEGEMVIEYVLRSTTNAWTATARRRSAREVGGPGIAPMFEMLLGAAPVTSGERRQIGGRWARAFVSSWTPPPAPKSQAPILTGDPMPNVAGDPAPHDATQSLWIDTASLLPLRWEVSTRGMLTHGFNITYESIDLRPPAGVDAPECIR